MGLVMRESGRKIKPAVKALSATLTATFTLATGSVTKQMGSVNSGQLTGASTKASGRMTCSTVMA